MTVELRFKTGTETYSDDEIVSMSPILTHTGMGDFLITIKGDRALEEYAARQERTHIAFDNSVEWTGYITGCSHSKSGGTTTIQGEGIAKRLKETRPDYESLGGDLTYSNIAVSDALRDYWARTPFSNHTVYDESVETVATDELLQSADTQSEWNDILDDAPDDSPITVDSTGLTMDPVTYLKEGENRDGGDNVTGNPTSTDYSGGLTVRLTETGDSAYFDFTLGYDIPDGNVAFWVRDGTDNGDNTPSFEWTIDGTRINGIDNVVGPIGIGWTNLSDGSVYDGPGLSEGLSAGDHTLQVTIEDGGNSLGTFLDVDVVAIIDTRYIDESNFSTNWDTVHEPDGYLDGPPIYGSGISQETTITPVSFNITDSDLTSTIDDTTGEQSVSVSNDRGATYATSNNSTSITHSYTGDGRELRTRFTLDNYGSRDTATPRFGFNTQTVDSFEHRASGNSKGVIVDLNLSKNHFDNLQTIHGQGDFVWAITHSDLSIENILVESFKRGEQTKTLPFEKEIDSTPQIAAKNYYNSIYLQGRTIDGERPSAEVERTSEIDSERGAISPGVLRDLDVATEAGAIYQAQQLLERATQNNALRGQKVYPARFDLVPGYSYAVDFGSGETEFTLEEISLRLGTNQAETTLDFVPPQDLSEDISALRRNSRQQSDQL